jgi:hypothetical protein
MGMSKSASERTSGAALRGLGALLLVGVLLLTSAALAQQPQQSYDLSWWTVDGGGGSSTAGGSYSLDGTAGQPDPGPILSGDGYSIEGGFWGGGVSGVTMFNIYLPLLLRSFGP